MLGSILGSPSFGKLPYNPNVITVVSAIIPILHTPDIAEVLVE